MLKIWRFKFQRQESPISQGAIGAETILQTESRASARETFICRPSRAASTEASHKQVLLCFAADPSSMQQAPPCRGYTIDPSRIKPKQSLKLKNAPEQSVEVSTPFSIHQRRRETRSRCLSIWPILGNDACVIVYPIIS